MKICPKCKILKSLSDFRLRSDRVNSYRSWCKQCYANYSSGYRRRFPDKVREASCQYSNSEKGKIARKKYDFRQQSLERFGGNRKNVFNKFKHKSRKNYLIDI